MSAILKYLVPAVIALAAVAVASRVDALGKVVFNK